MAITLGEISVRYANLLLKTAEDNGINTKGYREQFLLPDSKLEQPDARISIPRFMRLGHAMMEEHKIPSLGLLCGAEAQISLFGLVGYTALCAPTLEQALMDITEFEALSSNNARGHSSYSVEGNNGIAEFYSISPYNNFNYFIVDLALSVELTVIKQLTGQPINPTLVQFEFPEPEYTDAYSATFMCPIKFNQPRNALTFNLTDLNQPPLQANATSYLETRELCTQKLVSVRKKQSFIERVMNEISPLLTTRQPTMEQVAHGLGMPPWTLRRRLKEEKTTFKLLLDETRKSLALIYTRDAQYSLGEITYLLGFANPNAFQRAFKRWTGEPPGQYSKSIVR